MDIRLNALMRFVNRKSSLINAVLAAAAVICAVVLLKALWQPVYVQNGTGRKIKKTVRHDSRTVAESRRAYNVIVEKDIFRPARLKYVPPRVVIQPPPPKPPPKLALIGTVLQADGEEAILDYTAGGQKSSYYRVGDNIEGFVITDIRRDSVLLVRDGEKLRVGMRQSTQSGSSAPSVPNSPDVNTIPPRLRRQLTGHPPLQPSPQ